MKGSSRFVKASSYRTRPTRAGYIMMAMLVAMLVASINYGNNMAYILTFLLLSLLLVGLVYTRTNLKGLDIANLMPEPVFAGDRLEINLELHNQSSGRRFGIWLSHGEAGTAEDLSGPFAVEANSNSTADMTTAAEKRGRFVLSGIRLVTLYPLGLFMVAGQLKVEKSYIVYPRPEGTLPWPEPEVYEHESGEGFHMTGGDDFTGMRPYREGESMHHIDWKAVARGRPLSIKEFTGGGATQLVFNWDQLEGTRTERRLSQLCKWVLEADEQGTEFGLKLPGNKIGPDSGSTHTLRCLEALALFNIE